MTHDDIHDPHPTRADLDERAPLPGECIYCGATVAARPQLCPAQGNDGVARCIPADRAPLADPRELHSYEPPDDQREGAEYDGDRDAANLEALRRMIEGEDDADPRDAAATQILDRFRTGSGPHLVSGAEFTQLLDAIASTKTQHEDNEDADDSASPEDFERSHGPHAARARFGGAR